MWVDTYPYVHLHQPHPMFTAGNIKWTLGKPPAYLASKSEVLGHFQHCLDEIEKRLHVDEFFGWTVESEIEKADGVQVTCRAADGSVLQIETTQLIKAYGFRVEPNDPLQVSSSQVRSVSPDTCDVHASPMADSRDPVWIIGGGKTAMDTAHALITAYPGREVVDVVDTADGPQMTLRSGATLPITPGSWLVNCTGYIVHRRFAYEPFRSPGGRVLSIQSTSATLHLSSYMAYFSTHLFLSGKIREVPLCELDMLELYEKARKVWPYTLFALVGHNLSLYFDSLPSKAFRECGLDFDLWYPLPRRLLATAKFVRNHRREREHLRHTLDTVHERFGVRCGPLAAADRSAA